MPTYEQLISHGALTASRLIEELSKLDPNEIVYIPEVQDSYGDWYDEPDYACTIERDTEGRAVIR